MMDIGQLGSKTTASKLKKAFTLNTPYPRSKKGHAHVGVLSLTPQAEEINLHLCHLYLLNPSRTIESYRSEIHCKLGIHISEGTISNWFLKNNAYSLDFSQDFNFELTEEEV